ncbi:LysR family transcriptional regulator [Halotalea alkalilenta]|uniref:HTH lysR-type domain-containing protein n=1 Tax=Halotalea alkalilenta TaxID=376489 RepID=A0A172YE14_9GAMM|nr:LysR family transcriptional regulator [Halotalea alkalilenta]ANF57332.1 hypothetical protein A5892_07530 [Halotalea alkalilenta]
MQLRSLHYFDAVARCRSLRQAAALLHIVPTALSRQIVQLEHELGAKLIERSPKGVRLTAAGELLAEQASRTLKELDRVRERIDDLRELGAGHVSLYVTEGLAAGLVAPVLARLTRDHPRLRFTLCIQSAPAIVRALREGVCDIGVAFFIDEEEGIERRRVGRLEQCMIVAPSHPLANAQRVSLATLAAQQLALPDQGYGVRRTLDALAKVAGVEIDPAYVTASIEMQKALARSGAAALVLPRLAVAHECVQGEFVAVPIDEPRLSRVAIDLCVPAHAQPGFAVVETLARLAHAFDEGGVAQTCAA